MSGSIRLIHVFAVGVSLIVTAVGVAQECCGFEPNLLGPVWEEDTDGGGDAGSLPDDAQPTVGTGLLSKIVGNLTGFLLKGPPDFQDVYVIFICDPPCFQMSTTSFGGAANFDTQLWLFDPLGLGLLGNDDQDSSTLGSTVPNMSDDGTSILITTPGIYLVGISGFNSDPLGSSQPIFDQILPFEVSGPDGFGGSSIHDNWNPNNGDFGTYEIAFDGVTFAIQCPGDINFDGFVNVDDLLILLGSWGAGGGPADLDNDGDVDVDDVLIILANWGSCLPI